MKKIFAIIQIGIITGIIGYGTFCLYRGDFEGAYTTFPFLIFYYVFVVARKKRLSKNTTDESET